MHGWLIRLRQAKHQGTKERMRRNVLRHQHNLHVDDAQLQEERERFLHWQGHMAVGMLNQRASIQALEEAAA